MSTQTTYTGKAKLRQSRSTLVLGLTVLLTVVIIVSVIGWLVLKPEPEVIQGEVEASEIRISGKLAGRIEAFHVSEGDRVQAGELLVTISSPELQAKLEQAKAARSAANAQNQKAQKGAREEQIRGAYELWQKAVVGVNIAQKSYDRVKKLFDNEVISAQKFDEVEAQLEAAVATEKAARSQYDMAKNGAENEDKQAARALVERAEGAVSEVEAYLPETHLTASISGEVSEIYPKQGELVGSGAPIMTLVNLDDSWITFNIREDQLKAFRMGSVVHVDIPALGLENVAFRISYLKALGSYATWKATKTTGDFDRKTFEIRARPLSKIKDLRPGMSVLLNEKTE
jgi:HlyD family secretion protein